MLIIENLQMIDNVFVHASFAAKTTKSTLSQSTTLSDHLISFLSNSFAGESFDCSPHLSQILNQLISTSQEEIEMVEESIKSYVASEINFETLFTYLQVLLNVKNVEVRFEKDPDDICSEIIEIKTKIKEFKLEVGENFAFNGQIINKFIYLVRVD